ncbi:MAG: response regulator [Gammaproteobacteria bacterium]|nr:response regulator [Gammaproteobacteria bacterium]MCP5199020.1 response regulator [Gammaproteobacteria bacterium]
MTRLLYIEDNPVNARLLEKFFALKQRLHLAVATSADQGLALARAQVPDAILMDINLPGKSGAEALTELRADPVLRGVPVIAVSADARPEHVSRMLEHGFDAYLTKPVDFTELDATLARFLP